MILRSVVKVEHTLVAGALAKVRHVAFHKEAGDLSSKRGQGQVSSTERRGRAPDPEAALSRSDQRLMERLLSEMVVKHFHERLADMPARCESRNLLVPGTTKISDAVERLASSRYRKRKTRIF